jgi:hypothetical protein
MRSDSDPPRYEGAAYAHGMGQEPSADLQARLAHVLWIGGGPGAGKSTIARGLVDEYGLQLFTVEPFSKYCERLTPDEAPLLHEFMEMGMDDRWLNRSPERMFKTFHGFSPEGFHLIVEDLLAMPDDCQIAAEGFKLLPGSVAPLLRNRTKAIWLIPTSEFRRQALETRGSTSEIASKTSDPKLALANLAAQDAIFTDALSTEVLEAGLQSVQMDGSLDLKESIDLVAATFHLDR